MPEVEQRTQLGGHYFRVLRDISGDDYWGPWMTAPEGGLAASEVDSLAEPARACMRQLKRLDRRMVLALPSYLFVLRSPPAFCRLWEGLSVWPG